MPPKKSDAKKLEKLKLLEDKKKLMEGLPHLYGYKMYKWTRDYFNSTEKVQVICAGNQISKSSSQIRKAIHWATEPKLWKTLWPHMPHPRSFFYLYPSAYLATVEVDKKWIPEFMPQGEFKEHPQYGWEVEYRARYIQAIHFRTGCSIYFKTYSQDAQDLQGSSPGAIFADEEPPEELMPELQARLIATDGYFSIVFTPTLGQEFWREVVEERGPKERFKGAFKRQVSMYDCQFYEDGTPSFWTSERIERVKASCKSEAEIQRRVYGKFILDSGLRYPGFSQTHNVIPETKIPNDWGVYVGVDFGSGGKTAHPSAVMFVAMRPDFKLGYIFKGRRYDGQTMTASDLVEEVLRMKGELENPVYGIFYDYSCADLKEISLRMGQTWIPAEKSHAIGEQVLNVAFKNQMLFIFDKEELYPLISELKSLRLTTSKILSVDDAIDAARYASAKIPWDWSAIGVKPTIQPTGPQPETELRKQFFNEGRKAQKDIDAEFEEWDSLLNPTDYEY